MNVIFMNKLLFQNTTTASKWICLMYHIQTKFVLKWKKKDKKETLRFILFTNRRFF